MDNIFLKFFCVIYIFILFPFMLSSQIAVDVSEKEEISVNSDSSEDESPAGDLSDQANKEDGEFDNLLISMNSENEKIKGENPVLGKLNLIYTVFSKLEILGNEK